MTAVSPARRCCCMLAQLFFLFCTSSAVTLKNAHRTPPDHLSHRDGRQRCLRFELWRSREKGKGAQAVYESCWSLLPAMASSRRASSRTRIGRTKRLRRQHCSQSSSTPSQGHQGVARRGRVGPPLSAGPRACCAVGAAWYAADATAQQAARPTVRVCERRPPAGRAARGSAGAVLCGVFAGCSFTTGPAGVFASVRAGTAAGQVGVRLCGALRECWDPMVNSRRSSETASGAAAIGSHACSAGRCLVCMGACGGAIGTRVGAEQDQSRPSSGSALSLRSER